MNAKLLIVLGLAAVASAARPNYTYDWLVQHAPSRNNFGQTETRDLEDTQGSYFVNLPDGRRQTVTYYVNGDSGYIADVRYDGEASFESGSFESFERPRASRRRPATSAPQRRVSFDSFEDSRDVSFNRFSNEDSHDISFNRFSNENSGGFSRESPFSRENSRESFFSRQSPRSYF